MGDRCNVYVYVPESRAAEFERACQEINWHPEWDDEGIGEHAGWRRFEWSEVNYAAGLGMLLSDCSLPLEGFACFGGHGAGCEYGDGVFAYDGADEYAYAESNRDGRPVVSFRDDGEAVEGELEAVRDYCSVLGTVRKGVPTPA